jgi:hypothetical protein
MFLRIGIFASCDLRPETCHCNRFVYINPASPSPFPELSRNTLSFYMMLGLAHSHIANHLLMSSPKAYTPFRSPLQQREVLYKLCRSKAMCQWSAVVNSVLVVSSQIAPKLREARTRLYQDTAYDSHYVVVRKGCVCGERKYFCTVL